MNTKEEIIEEKEIKFLSLSEDAVFKAFWLIGSDETKKKLRDMVSYILDYDIKDYELMGVELPITNYESIFNKVDLLLINRNENKLLNIELNREKNDQYINKNNSYLYKMAGEFYAYIGTESEDNYKEPIKATQLNINCFPCPEDKNVIISTYQFMDEKHRLIDLSITKKNIYVAKSLKKCYDNEKLKDYLMFVCESYEEMEELAQKDKGRLAIMEDIKRIGGDIAFTNHINSTIDNKIIERQIMREELEEEVRNEVTKKITEEVTEEVTERVTEEVTAQVTEEVTAQVTEEVTAQVTEEVTERVTEELIISMYKGGLTINKIAEILKTPKEKIEIILNKK